MTQVLSEKNVVINPDSFRCVTLHGLLNISSHTVGFLNGSNEIFQGPSSVAQLLKVLFQYAKVVVLIPGQGTYEN